MGTLSQIHDDLKRHYWRNRLSRERIYVDDYLEYPMLFSNEMIRVIGYGSKTMTRRTSGLSRINIAPDEWRVILPRGGHTDVKGRKLFPFENLVTGNQIDISCPYGFPNQTLIYTKERHKVNGRVIPSMHQPKEDARYVLLLTDVKVERLNSISNFDAIREGVLREENGHLFKNYQTGEYEFDNPELSFSTLWKKINGDESWYGNPWVFVIRFEILYRNLEILYCREEL